MSITVRRVFNSAQFPQSLDIGTAQTKGITVDNYSNFWLQVGVDGMFVPPHTLKWADNFYGTSASSIQIVKGAPLGVPQAILGDAAVIVAGYDTAIAPSSGVSTSSLQGYAFTNQQFLVGALAPVNVLLTGVGGAPATAVQFWLEAIVLTYIEDAAEPLPPVNTAVFNAFPGLAGVNDVALIITPANPVAQVDFHHLLLPGNVINGSVRASAATDIQITYIFSAL